MNSWDEAKRQLTLAKRGLDFADAELVLAGSMDRKVGTVCGKLLSISASFDLPEEQLVDSTGIYITPMLRHLDRGSQEPDRGHYLNFE